jgi:hypothetical protein
MSTNDEKREPDAEEVRWIQLAAQREEEGGGFPGVTGALVGRVRGGPLAGLPTEFKDWTTIRDSIRAVVPRVFINKLERALRTDNLGAAMEAAWRAVIDDLRRKVIRFGLQRFAALEGMPPLRAPEDLEGEITEHRLLVGCRQLGLLDEEAYVQLNHCRALISGYLASARFQSDPDRLDTLNFIKNCIKYCLMVDGPTAGLDIQRLMDLVESEDLEDRLHELENALTEMPAEAPTLVRLLFRRYVEPRVEARADANILRLFPVAWARADDDTRKAIGEEFVSVRLNGTSDQAQRAFGLLQWARGLSYLPPSVLSRYIIRASQSLLDAHNAFGNFHAEVRPAQYLADFGSNIPVQARDIYVRAIAICFLGNPYGVSTGAVQHLEGMLSKLDVQLVSKLFDLLRSDPDLRSTLMSSKPAERLPRLVALVRDRISRLEDRQFVEKITNLSPDEISRFFSRRTAA